MSGRAFGLNSVTLSAAGARSLGGDNRSEMIDGLGLDMCLPLQSDLRPPSPGFAPGFSLRATYRLSAAREGPPAAVGQKWLSAGRRLGSPSWAILGDWRPF